MLCYCCARLDVVNLPLRYLILVYLCCDVVFVMVCCFCLFRCIGSYCLFKFVCSTDDCCFCYLISCVVVLCFEFVVVCLVFVLLLLLCSCLRGFVVSCALLFSRDSLFVLFCFALSSYFVVLFCCACFVVLVVLFCC